MALELKVGDPVFHAKTGCTGVVTRVNPRNIAATVEVLTRGDCKKHIFGTRYVELNGSNL